MKPYISPKMQDFLTPKGGEEALDQPLYHLQSYAAAGVGSLTFFNTATGSATNGLSDTNMDTPNVLSAGKRFGVFAVSVAYIGGQDPVQATANTTLDSILRDAKRVLEGISNFQLTILDKVYLVEAPLTRLPAGIGLHTGAGGIQRTQAAAADGTFQVSYASNGMPMVTCRRKLLVPLPIPQQVRFEAKITFPSVITVQTAGRIGCWLDGVLIRAQQ